MEDEASSILKISLIGKNGPCRHFLKLLMVNIILVCLQGRRVVWYIGKSNRLGSGRSEFKSLLSYEDHRVNVGQSLAFSITYLTVLL